jgi:cytochrome b561
MLDLFGTDSAGIAKTFLVHGVVYAVFMSLGWLLVRVPRPDWKLHGWIAAPPTAGSIATGGQVSANNAIKTPQFWLLWLCCAST